MSKQERAAWRTVECGACGAPAEYGCHPDCDVDGCGCPTHRAQSLAERVEELEERVADWKQDSDFQSRQADQLRRENERLREALEEIALWESDGISWRYDFARVCDIAANALSDAGDADSREGEWQYEGPCPSCGDFTLEGQRCPICAPDPDAPERDDGVEGLSDGVLASRLSHAASYYAADDYESKLFSEASRRIHAMVQGDRPHHGEGERGGA